MKLLCLALALLPLTFALEPEFSLEPENTFDTPANELSQPTDEPNFSDEMQNVLNQILENEGGLEETDVDNEFGEEDNPLNVTEGLNEVVQASWDIGPPGYVVKKARKLPKRGKILKAIVLTKQFKSAIVIAHNRARSIAIPPASNMKRMTWDNGLAKLATSYSRKCIYEHNPDPKHGRFDYVGENLFISMGLPYNKKLLDHAVRAWDGEKSFYNYDKTTCQPGKVCGHYTQVVWADSFKVGCGVTRCGNINVRGRIWRDAILFGCNYGPGGNYRGEKPYKRGSKCSDCATTDKCKGKLCANLVRDRIFFNPKLAKWSNWSAWTPCSKTCGMGSKRRERKCNTFVPTDCKGYGSEVRFCMNKPCQSNSNTFRYELVLNEGDNFFPGSLSDLFKGKGIGSKRTFTMDG